MIKNVVKQSGIMICDGNVVKYHGSLESVLIRIMKFINSLRRVGEGENILKVFKPCSRALTGSVRPSGFYGFPHLVS